VGKRRLNPTAWWESPEKRAVAYAGTLRDHADTLSPPAAPGSHALGARIH